MVRWARPGSVRPRRQRYDRPARQLGRRTRRWRCGKTPALGGRPAGCQHLSDSVCRRRPRTARSAVAAAGAENEAGQPRRPARVVCPIEPDLGRGTACGSRLRQAAAPQASRSGSGHSRSSRPGQRVPAVPRAWHRWLRRRCAEGKETADGSERHRVALRTDAPWRKRRRATSDEAAAESAQRRVAGTGGSRDR